MKKFIVYAERTTLESVEIEANNEDEAQKIAFETENDSWKQDEDTDWQIFRVKEITE